MKKQLVEDIKSVANMTIDGKPVSGIDKCKNIAYSSIDANCMNEIRTALKNANDLLESQERNSKK